MPQRVGFLLKPTYIASKYQILVEILCIHC